MKVWFSATNSKGNDNKLTRLDPTLSRAGDEADIESEGATVRPKSKNHSSKDDKSGPKPHQPARSSPVEISDENDEDDEDDEGEEETFAVEKVLNHRISKKRNVLSAHLSTSY